MFKRLVTHLLTGFTLVRHNTRLLMVGALVFLFPVFFLWVNQQFFATAHQNITSSEKQRVQTIHDLLALTISHAGFDITSTHDAFRMVAADNPDITTMQLLRTATTTDELVVIAALTPEARATRVDATPFRQLPLAAEESSFIVPTLLGSDRVWQVYRQLSEEGHYLYTVHDFSLTDSLISARQQQSYLALTLIFVFLIALAYWIYQQDDWSVRSRQLSTRLAERDHLANMIAHELRSPLTAVSGYASFLAESSSLSREEQEYVSIIRRSTDRLVRLVNDFLEVSRIQAGKLGLTWQTVSLNDLLHDVMSSETSTATQKNITLQYDQLPAAYTITTDPDRLTQVLTNLVSNGIKYTDPGGTVSIATERTSRNVTIRIMDTGHGMSAAEQAKLFTPFTRFGSSTDQTTVTGTGLGMWITKQLVEQLGGTIEVESIKGQGTHVILTLPTEPPE